MSDFETLDNKDRSNIGSSGASGGAQAGQLAGEAAPAEAGAGGEVATERGAESAADAAEPGTASTADPVAAAEFRSLDSDVAAGPGAAAACSSSLPDEAKRGLEFASSGLAREYVWRETGDGGERYEATLRFQPSGQWWHAAHLSRRARASPSRTAGRKCWYRSLPRSQPESPALSDSPQDMSPVGSSPCEDADTWELAECLGSWQAVRLGKDGGSWAVVLTCEHCRWSSDRPNAAVRLRPSPQVRKDTEKSLDSGKHLICFALTGGPEGDGCLKLETSKLPPVEGLTRRAFQRSAQAARQALGFARSYDESVPQRGDAGGAAPASTAAAAVGEPAAEVGGKAADESPGRVQGDAAASTPQPAGLPPA